MMKKIFIIIYNNNRPLLFYTINYVIAISIYSIYFKYMKKYLGIITHK